jgi:hypothetical protein
VTRWHVAAWIFVALIFSGSIAKSISALDGPDPPEDVVRGFVDAFNEGDEEKVCDILTPTARQALEPSPVDLVLRLGVDEYLELLERSDGDDCRIGADAIHQDVGRISAGAITRTIHETDQLTYAVTRRGRWKLIWDGNSWRVADHPPLRSLAASEHHARHAEGRIAVALADPTIARYRRKGH